MAYFDTGADLLLNFLRRAGELFPTDTTTTTADRVQDAKLYVNSGYWALSAVRPWRWARKDPPAQVLSVASQAVTVTTVSGATVTLSAALAASQTGRKFFFDGEAIPHRISAHVAATATLTLATSYAGDLTSGAATIFMDELTVATDILGFPLIQELHSGDDLIVIPEGEFRRMFPRNIQGHVRAKYACFVTGSKIRIAPWTTSVRLFECSYNARPDPLDFLGGAADTPIVPREGRELIGIYALRKLMADKRDARIALVDQEIGEKMALLTGQEITFQKPRAAVRPGARVMP